MNEDILNEIWKAPVFVYNLRGFGYFAIGNGALWDISMNGMIYAAYCNYCMQSDADLVNGKILGNTPILKEILGQIEKIKSKKPKIQSYDKFVEIIKEYKIDTEDLGKQYTKISRLRKLLL